MNITRKIDRAKQWAGEKLGAETRAVHSDEFKILEAQMDVRHEGMEHLQKSMNIYSRWLSRRCDALEDRSRSMPLAVFGRNMSAHGTELEPDSEFGSLLVALGNANEQLAELQSSYVDCANATWVQQIERNLAMMKEFQAARKKLENRRLAYDATMNKMQKAKKDDVRLEEELRINKTKFDDSTEDVFQRMQDIKEAEADTVASLNAFLDAELEYHERAANELRRVRRSWAAGSPNASRPPSQGAELDRMYSNTSMRSQSLSLRPTPFTEASENQVPAYKLTRTMTQRAAPPPPPASSRPPVLRSATFDTRHASYTRARASSASLPRAATDGPIYGGRSEDIFDDDTSNYSGDISPSSGWGNRSISPATSYGSFRGNPNAQLEGKKVAPPPPVNRARKPPPPPVPRKTNLGC